MIVVVAFVERVDTMEGGDAEGKKRKGVVVWADGW